MSGIDLTGSDLLRLAAELGIAVAPHEEAEFVALADFISKGLVSQVDFPDLDRDGVGKDVREMSASEPHDPFNAVITWCDVGGASDGELAGKRVGVKDNIAVSGVRTSCGLAWMNHTPEQSAVVVNRLLAAGAQITAKLNMDAFAWSGGADTSSFGPVLNPVDMTRSAGGSSGGSAAALYLPEIDITLGTDQGGSVRVPASWCGVLGMKPTYGLIPYTGIMGMEGSVDHVGPMARTADDLICAMSVMAGVDGDDYRQHAIANTGALRTTDHHPMHDLSNVTLGLLAEGIRVETDTPPGTSETVTAALDSVEILASLGATVRTVSVPGHLAAPAYLFVLLMEGSAGSLMSPTSGYGHKGAQDWKLDLARRRALSHGQDIPATVRITAIMGAKLRSDYWGAAYSWVRERIGHLDAAIDHALSEVDFIVLPTTTHYAHRFLENERVSENVIRGWNMFANTISTSLTGHPAISLPMARVGSAPVGVMFVAPKGHDSRLLTLAKTIEDAAGWYPDPSR